MIEKYFDNIEIFEEINGHFNKNFKVKTNEGLFHLKIFSDGKSEIKKWIEGTTVQKWEINTIKLLEVQLKLLKGSAPEMDLLNLDIKDSEFLKLVDMYKNEEKVYCHNDLNKDNMIIDKNKLTLIDFEFARMNHKYWEYANIIVEDNVEKALFLGALPFLDSKVLDDWIYINKTYTDAWKRKHQNK